MSDFEQCKEELQFSTHQNSELKESLEEEKSRSRELQVSKNTDFTMDDATTTTDEVKKRISKK